MLLHCLEFLFFSTRVKVVTLYGLSLGELLLFGKRNSVVTIPLPLKPVLLLLMFYLKD